MAPRARAWQALVVGAHRTVGERWDAGETAGFDYLRVALALAVIVWHSFATSYGRDFALAVYTGPFGRLPATMMPMFFTLSGFLIAGSLVRTPTLHGFLTLRVLRIAPALSVEILLSALILGPLFTTAGLGHYVTAPAFRSYFLNIVGWIHFDLPGVFQHNPSPSVVNLSLWTIPFELECYILISVAWLAGVVKRPVLLLIAAAVMTAVLPFIDINAVDGRWARPPGRELVLSFVLGVLAHLYRDRLPMNRWLAGACLVACVIQTHSPLVTYFSAWPAAYLTVWLGLHRAPPLKLGGDYSYGLYLFAFPIQQAVAQFAPLRHWWANLLITIPLAGAYAAFSWRVIEKPILAKKRAVLEKIDRLFRPRLALGSGSSTDASG